jgi:hypothetical protein
MAVLDYLRDDDRVFQVHRKSSDYNLRATIEVAARQQKKVVQKKNIPVCYDAASYKTGRFTSGWKFSRVKRQNTRMLESETKYPLPQQVKNGGRSEKRARIPKQQKDQISRGLAIHRTFSFDESTPEAFDAHPGFDTPKLMNTDHKGSVDAIHRSQAK